ncbi:MAG: MFS transporter [Verrucomicrobia bacterium]|nr:MFS transporter [Verrucomicrobiota bacterium]
MSSKWILRMACMMQVASMGILFTFEAVRMKDLGIGETTIGINLGVSSGVFIFSSLYWGRLADRKHWHKAIAVWGSLALSALLVYFSICESVWEFLTYAIVKAILAPMVFGMMPALAVKALGPKQQGRNFGVYRAFGSLGFLLGSMTLPIIFNDIVTVARCGSLIIFLSFFLLRRLSEPETKPVHGAPLRIGELNSTLCLFFISFFFIALAEPAVHAFFTAYARHLGGSTRLLGILSGIMAITSLIFLPLMGKWSDRANPVFIISIAFLAQPLRVYIISFIGQAEMLWIPLLLHGLCWGGIEVAAIVYLSSLAKEGQKATVLSFYMAMRMLGNLVGAGLTGYLAETYGYVVMFHTMATAALIGAVIYIIGTYVLKIGQKGLK